jgi:chromosome segregation ATPase
MDMKETLIAAVVPFALLAGSVSVAATEDCGTRANAIQTQLDAARQFGNTAQAARLQIALAEVKARCTDAGQVRRAQRKVDEKQRDVRKAEDEIREAEARLSEAQARGDSKKIAKAQKKLADKRSKLQEQTSKLRDAQTDLTAIRG